MTVAPLPRRGPQVAHHVLTGNHVFWMRHQLKESQREFAKRWNVSHRTVESWELDARHPNRWVAKRMLALYRSLESGELS